MATFLLIVIFFAFIGLGIPDSIFGPAWPAINAEFNLPDSYANFITVIISVFTVLSSIFSDKLIKWLGTGLVTALSTMLTALALLGFSFAGSMFYLCLLSVPLGVGAGSIDAALNGYVAINYKPKYMNFLHCFYGIGVAASPFLMSLGLAGSGGWRDGYRIVFLVQAAIAVFTFVALPIWKKADSKNGELNRENTSNNVKFSSVLKIKSLKYVWIVFFCSCAIEFTCGTWGSTFLIKARGLATEKAVLAMSFYYGGMALGRFISGLISGKVTPWRIILFGQAIVLSALILLALPLPLYVGIAAISLIGFGNGPLFPNLTHLTPYNFGKDISQTVIGTQMAACNIGITLMPPVFGFIAQYLGSYLLPYYLLILYAVMMLSVLFFVKTNRKEKSEKELQTF